MSGDPQSGFVCGLLVTWSSERGQPLPGVRGCLRPNRPAPPDRRCLSRQVGQPGALGPCRGPRRLPVFYFIFNPVAEVERTKGTGPAGLVSSHVGVWGFLKDAWSESGQDLRPGEPRTAPVAYLCNISLKI